MRLPSHVGLGFLAIGLTLVVARAGTTSAAQTKSSINQTTLPANHGETPSVANGQNTMLETLQWSVSAPTTWGVAPGEGVPVSVTVQSGREATGVKILQSSLIEKDSKRPLSAGVLCPTNSECGTSAFNGRVPAKTTTVVWLDTAGAGAGQYLGNLAIAADGSADGKQTQQMTIYVSSGWWKAWGVVWIAFGVAMAFLTTVVVRNRINRDQMLLPAQSLRDSLAVLQQRLKKRPAGLITPNTDNKIEELLKTLSDSALETNGLPAKTVSPWTPAMGTTVSTYQTYLSGISSWVLILSDVMRGFESTFAVYDASVDTLANVVRTCVSEIDALVQGHVAPSEADTIAKIDDSVTKMKALVGSTGAAGARIAGMPSTVGATSTQALEVELSRLTFAGWSLISLAIVATGAYVMVYSSNGAGFGRPSDYLACFLWGLGLPAASTLLQGTASTVTTQFKLAT